MNISQNITIALRSFDVHAVHCSSGAEDKSLIHADSVNDALAQFEAQGDQWIATSVRNRQTGQVTTLHEYRRIDTGERCRRSHPMATHIAG